MLCRHIVKPYLRTAIIRRSLRKKDIVTSWALRQTIPSFQRHHSTMDASRKGAEPEAPEQALPKLSVQEFRQYNRLAEHMDMFHENFRRTWTMLYGACESGKRPQGMSIRAFLAAGDQFVHHLTIHHGIEEQHIFPVLAKKMPAFRKELELLTQHKQIHAGLDQFEEYLADVRSGKRDLVYGDMKAVMDTFGTVLWTHLDDEVRQLGAENMRRYWTIDEIKRIPM